MNDERIGELATLSAYGIETRVALYAEADTVTVQIFTGSCSLHIRMNRADTEALSELFVQSLEIVKFPADPCCPKHEAMGNNDGTPCEESIVPEPAPPQRCAHGKTVDEPCGDCLADEGLDDAPLAHAEAEQEL